MAKDQKKIMGWWIAGAFLIFIFLYAFFVSKNLIFGVKLKNISIVDGATYTEGLLEVSGNAKNAINVSLNSSEVAIDQAGNFHETIALSPGYNIITLEAKDKFGNSDENNYKIIYKN